MNDKTKDREQNQINRETYNNLTKLTTATLFVLGMLTAKKDLQCARILAKVLKEQGVECDYIQPILDIPVND